MSRTKHKRSGIHILVNRILNPNKVQVVLDTVYMGTRRTQAFIYLTNNVYIQASRLPLRQMVCR